MKKITFFLLVGLLWASYASASPVGYANQGRSYLGGAADLTGWSGHLYGGVRTREVEMNNSIAEMESSVLLASVGYDIIRWITIYGTLGWNQTDFGMEDDEDSKVEYGAGAVFNLLDHEIMDPNLMEDRLRVNAGLDWRRSESEWYADTVKWSNFSTWLTVGFVNDSKSNKAFGPTGIGIYAGPIYSGINGDIEETENFGAVGGLDIYYTERITFGVRVEYYDDTSVTGGLRIRL